MTGISAASKRGSLLLKSFPRFCSGKTRRAPGGFSFKSAIRRRIGTMSRLSPRWQRERKMAGQKPGHGNHLD